QEVTHAAKAESVQVNEHAPVTGPETPVQLIEHRRLPRPALSVQHDGGISVLADQVALDEREHVIAAVKHLRAADRCSRDLGVGGLFLVVQGRLFEAPGPRTLLSSRAIAATDCGSLAQVRMSCRSRAPIRGSTSRSALPCFALTRSLALLCCASHS